jgi:hypothetical protein
MHAIASIDTFPNQSPNEAAPLVRRLAAIFGQRGRSPASSDNGEPEPRLAVCGASLVASRSRFCLGDYNEMKALVAHLWLDTALQCLLD